MDVTIDEYSDDYYINNKLDDNGDPILMPHQEFAKLIYNAIEKIGGNQYKAIESMMILKNKYIHIIVSFDFSLIEEFSKILDNILHDINFLRDQYLRGDSEFTTQVKTKILHHDYELYISTYIKLLDECKMILDSWKKNVFLHDNKVKIDGKNFFESYRRIIKIIKICEYLGVDLTLDYYCVICCMMFLDECGHGPYYFCDDGRYNSAEPKKKILGGFHYGPWYIQTDTDHIDIHSCQQKAGCCLISSPVCNDCVSRFVKSDKFIKINDQ
jgi:hypothetical protein